MRLRVLDWNVDGWHTITGAQLDLIEHLGWDVLLLQEVTPRSMDLLRERLGADGTLALEHLPTGHRGRARGGRVRFGAAVLTRAGLPLSETGVLEHVPSPERTATGTIDAGATKVTLASLAMPPGVVWGDMKREQGDLVAEWLTTRADSVIVGCDRNGPRAEGLEAADTQWWPRDSRALWGTSATPHDPGERRHTLVDVFERWLDERPDERARITAERPTGPLAVTYVRRGRQPRPSRYDVILTTVDVKINDAHHVERRINSLCVHWGCAIMLTWPTMSRSYRSTRPTARSCDAVSRQSLCRPAMWNERASCCSRPRACRAWRSPSGWAVRSRR